MTTTSEITSTILNFKEGEITSVVVDGTPYFVGNDVAEALGYSTPRDVVVKRVDEDNKTKARIKYKGQKRTITLINEVGLTNLIVGCELLTQAQKKEWLAEFNLEDMLTSRKEIEFLQLLEGVLSPLGLTLERQYIVNGYRLDGYVPEMNIAVEYDERHHDLHQEKDYQRESDIQREIGCKFIRVSYTECDSVNVGYVVKAIMEIQKEKYKSQTLTNSYSREGRELPPVLQELREILG